MNGASVFAIQCRELSGHAAEVLHRLALRAFVSQEDEACMQSVSQLPAAALWAHGSGGDDVPEPELFHAGARNAIQGLFTQAFRNVKSVNGATYRDRLLDIYRTLIAVSKRERVDQLRLADASDALKAFHEAASSVYAL